MKLNLTHVFKGDNANISSSLTVGNQIETPKGRRPYLPTPQSTKGGQGLNKSMTWVNLTLHAATPKSLLDNISIYQNKLLNCSKSQAIFQFKDDNQFTNIMDRSDLLSPNRDIRLINSIDTDEEENDNIDNNYQTKP